MTTTNEQQSKKRLTVEYSESTATRLSEIQSELGLKSPIDVVRIAVKLLSYLLKQKSDGWQLVLRKEGQEKTFDHNE